MEAGSSKKAEATVLFKTKEMSVSLFQYYLLKAYYITTNTMPREYIHDIDPEYDWVYTVDEWFAMQGNWSSDWGNGYWAKDGKVCRDEVYSSKPEDATHVVWYNK